MVVDGMMLWVHKSDAIMAQKENSKPIEEAGTGVSKCGGEVQDRLTNICV